MKQEMDCDSFLIRLTFTDPTKAFMAIPSPLDLVINCFWEF